MSILRCYLPRLEVLECPWNQTWLSHLFRFCVSFFFFSAQLTLTPISLAWAHHYSLKSVPSFKCSYLRFNQADNSNSSLPLSPEATPTFFVSVFNQVLYTVCVFAVSVLISNPHGLKNKVRYQTDIKKTIFIIPTPALSFICSWMNK